MKTEFEIYKALIEELKEYEYLRGKDYLTDKTEDSGYISFDYTGPMQISIRITKLLNMHQVSEFPVIHIHRFNDIGFWFREEDLNEAVKTIKELLDLQEVQKQYHKELQEVTNKFKPLFQDKLDEYSKTWTSRSYECRDGTINWVQDRQETCPCHDDKCWAAHHANRGVEFKEAYDYCHNRCKNKEVDKLIKIKCPHCGKEILMDWTCQICKKKIRYDIDNKGNRSNPKK